MTKTHTHLVSRRARARPSEVDPGSRRARTVAFGLGGELLLGWNRPTAGHPPLDARDARIPSRDSAERPHDHRDELRLWLRLFTCKEVIETEVRRRLRDSFEVTLPRFDLLAQLDRAPKGMTLGELSQRMMVSNGNVTGLVDRLVEQGLINRRPSPKDRRAQIVSLTAEGRRFFRAMARENGDWIGEMFADLSAGDIETLLRLLAKTKASARKAIGNGGPR